MDEVGRRGDSLMFDFHGDWRAWSATERITAATFIVGFASLVVAWVAA
jgi:hypothetical protein